MEKKEYRASVDLADLYNTLQIVWRQEIAEIPM